MTTPSDDRVKEGIEHLQAAALELIAAARVFLDVAEDACRGAAERPERPERRRDDPGVERIRVV